MARDAWFVLRDGKEVGPFTLAVLKDRAAKGFINTDTMVRNADAPVSVKAGTVAGLFDKPAPAPRPTPPTAAPKPAVPPKPPAQPRAVAPKPPLPRSPPKPAARPTPPPTPSSLPATASTAKKNKKPLIIGLSAGALALLTCCGGLGFIAVSKRADKGDKSEQVAAGATKEVSAASSSGDQVVLVDAPAVVMPESPFQNPFRFSADGGFLLVNGSAVWNVRTSKRLESDARFLASDLSPDGKTLAAIESGGRNKLLVLGVGDNRLALKQRVDLGRNNFYYPTWSPDGMAVALHSDFFAPPNAYHGVIVALEAVPRLTYFSNPGSPDRNPPKVTHPFAAFSPDGKRLTVWYDEPSVCVHEVATGKILERKASEPSGTPPSLWDLRLVPNDDGRIEVWNVKENRLAAVVGKSDGRNRSFRTITPDGRFVASAQHQKQGVEVWDIQQGRKVAASDYRRPVAAPDYHNVKAPPMSDAVYNQIREGMTSVDVWKLAGGKPFDDASTRHEEGKLGTDWILEVTEHYHSKDHPGFRIVLVYRGKGTQPPLIKKAIVR